MADEYEGHIVVQNATFNKTIRHGERFINYIKGKEKN